MLQMPPAHDLIVPVQTSSCFLQFIAVLEQFVAYIQESEGIHTAAIYPHEQARLNEKFNSLAIETQRRKLKRFVDYYEYCREQAALGVSLGEKRLALKAFLRKFGLHLPEEDKIFEILDERTFIEIYDLDFIQCYRSLDFFNVTSHSMMALETCEWWDLFERSEEINQEIMSVVRLIYSQELRRPVYAPVPSHTVKELGSISPRSSQADILLYSPVYDDEEVFQGGLHLFKVNSVYNLDFKLVL